MGRWRILTSVVVAMTAVGSFARPALAQPPLARSWSQAAGGSATVSAAAIKTPAKPGAYRLVGSDGGIFSFGGAGFYGSTGGIRLNQPIVAMADTPDGGGYWMVARDGGVFAFGDAGFYGSLGGQKISAPIVGIAPTPDGKGYWLVGSDGQVYGFGDASLYGSLYGVRLNRPIVGIAVTPSGGGYWLVASDGGVFSFGDARFYGSMGGVRLNRPIVGISATPDGAGYWLVASDGGVFSFGHASFVGSMGGQRLNAPVVGMSSSAGNGLGESVDPCPGSTTALANEGPVVGEHVRIPAVPVESIPQAPASVSDPPAADVPASYAGTILRPADTAAYPGPRPGVVLLHGIGGNQCALWWLSLYLAGRGYVTTVLTSPTPPGHPGASQGVEIDAARSAVAFLSSPTENPFSVVTDPDNLGLAGWSEGSIAASVAQGLPGMGAVKAIVALDNLRGSLRGDAGAPFTWCVPPVVGPVTPKVPALGFASDFPCNLEPNNTSPTLKQSGWVRWQQASIASVELPMADFTHFTFAIPTQAVAHLSREWFGAWLERKGNSALSSFEACTTTGLPAAGILSAHYHSAAFLPSLGLDTNALGQQLARSCHEVVGSTPAG